MKLLTYRYADKTRTGILEPEGIYDLTGYINALALDPRTHEHILLNGGTPATGGMMRLLQAGPDAIAHIPKLLHHRDRLGRPVPLTDVVLLAPVPRPGKIIAVGRNYGEHAKEAGMEALELPRLIGSFPSSVAPPGSIVRRPRDFIKLDLEASLAVVIQKYGFDVREAEANDYIAGYTVVNDISARELLFDVWPPQTTFAKSMDGFTPMGPWMVTADEIADPQALTVSSWVNGELMQQGSTADMIFSVSSLIAYISRTMTLEPGDIIMTGTPAGSGATRNPPRYLQPGDRVRIKISQVGVLEHEIG
ncbi:fumarylacetoacetate hydrolase family protein [Parapusillimonas sp. SGNA-6]|nr:fumarylacetoacetate hydrolase family protein [Parapusillimonas sp. SGNA-6]